METVDVKGLNGHQ